MTLITIDLPGIGDSFTLHHATRASQHDRANRAISREKLVPSRDDDDGTAGARRTILAIAFRRVFRNWLALCRAMRAE